MFNFDLIRSEEIRELNTRASIYLHRPTGAEILSLENDDENKCFGVALRTPPSDSTGVAHILEHTVFCGSRKYPLKDPFVQLLKGSLQTYLNAFTYPDKTGFPVASQNLKDFHNLVDVYLDAVFHPLITKDFFMQEGWHYELESPQDELTYKGVVYNEMKGVYSSPESLLMECSQQSLFPDTTYGLDSGGNPEFIPDLSYPQFKAFHASFYHPSNARIFFYGDDPVDERFRLLEEHFRGFERITPESDIILQKPFDRPIHVEKTYAVSSDDENPKPMFSINWGLTSPTDAKQVFAWELLDHILLGTAASPLRKALIESGLGEDITGGGLETHLKQMMFSVGLNGVEEKNLQQAEVLVIQTLGELAEKGISHDDIEAALNSFEFDLRENNSGGFPRGLSVFLKSINAWIYGADPLELVSFKAPLEEVKRQALQAGYFEQLIRKFLVENTHRSTVVLLPDAGLAERSQIAEKERLNSVKAQMGDAELKQVVANTRHLLNLQDAPDSVEAIASLPLLQRDDLDKDIRSVEHSESRLHGVTVLTHELPTNGILYLDIGFDLHGLDPVDIPLVSLLGSALLEMGTQRQDYVSLSQRIAKKTGGIYATPFLSAVDDSDTAVARYFLRAKCMLDQTREMLDILSEVLLHPNFDNPVRFKQIVLEYKASMENALLQRGHSVVMSRLKARYHEAHWAQEQMAGIDALFFVRQLADSINSDWPAIQQRLEQILATLLERKRILVNVTVDPDARGRVLKALDGFVEQFPEPSHFSFKNWQSASLPLSEALTITSQVNYVGCAARLFDAGYELHGSSLVISHYLQTAWLWQKIRVLGGAYGGMCSFDPRSGTFVFASYRDPNLEASLETYWATGEYLENLKLDEDELTRALIGAIGQLDSYQLPHAKAYSSVERYLINYSDEKRQQIRNQVLATTQADFNAFGSTLKKAFKNPAIAVLCSSNAANQAGLENQVKLF